MKYSQWNDLLFEYYFLEDKGHQVFLGLDKDTLVDYVIDKGCFNDVVDRVQQATPNRVIKPEEYIWNDFLAFSETRMEPAQRIRFSRCSRRN